MKILMVCLGNICRSPMAEGLMHSKIKKNNLPIEVDSAGTANYHIGKAPAAKMQVTAKNHDCPINTLKARQFIAKDFDDFDFIYAMDESNYNNIIDMARTMEDTKKVFFLLNELNPGSFKEVPDPYYGDMSDFEACYQLLDLATDALLINKNFIK